jgi:hypothetical protein
MDSDVVGTAGYVAIVPLELGKARLRFVVLTIDCAMFENRIFSSMEEAKRFVDSLLAFESGEIPIDDHRENGDDLLDDC